MMIVITITRNLIKVDNTYLRIFQRISNITIMRIISNAPPNPTTRPTISPSSCLSRSAVPAAVEVVEPEVVFLEVIVLEVAGTTGEILGVDLMVLNETDGTDVDVFVLKDVTMTDVADSPGVVTALAVLVVFLAVDDLVTFDFATELDSVVPHTHKRHLSVITNKTEMN